MTSANANAAAIARPHAAEPSAGDARERIIGIERFPRSSGSASPLPSRPRASASHSVHACAPPKRHAPIANAAAPSSAASTAPIVKARAPRAAA